MTKIQLFIKEVEEASAKHGMTCVLLYGADESDSFQYSKGLTVEACHGVCQSLTQTFALRSDKIARERAGIKPTLTSVPS